MLSILNFFFVNYFKSDSFVMSYSGDCHRNSKSCAISGIDPRVIWDGEGEGERFLSLLRKASRQRRLKVWWMELVVMKPNCWAFLSRTSSAAWCHQNMTKSQESGLWGLKAVRRASGTSLPVTGWGLVEWPSQIVW